MAKTVFISYSHKDARWLAKLRPHLQPLDRDGEVDAWDDTRIKSGLDWLKEIQNALAGARVAILLISADFLASEFIIRIELPRLLSRAKRQGCLILPLVLRACRFSEMHALQKFQAVNSPKRPLAGMKAPEAEGYLVKTAQSVFDHLAEFPRIEPRRPLVKTPPKRNPRVEAVIKPVALADWAAATQAALSVVAETKLDGSNSIFDALFTYQDCSDEDDRFWGALHTIEICAKLAPWLISHRQLAQMASHRNFSVRSSAAAICMDLAHSAPDRVPLDILLKLSVHDEDWYVEVPANSALKAMARTFPDVLEVFFNRLHSKMPEARSHAASALRDISRQEPDLLDTKRLRGEVTVLRRAHDAEALKYLEEAARKVRQSKPRQRYRYAF
jgi:hypothetical protein